MSLMVMWLIRGNSIQHIVGDSNEKRRRIHRIRSVTAKLNRNPPCLFGGEMYAKTGMTSGFVVFVLCTWLKYRLKAKDTT